MHNLMDVQLSRYLSSVEYLLLFAIYLACHEVRIGMENARRRSVSNHLASKLKTTKGFYYCITIRNGYSSGKSNIKSRNCLHSPENFANRTKRKKIHTNNKSCKQEKIKHFVIVFRELQIFSNGRLE